MLDFFPSKCVQQASENCYQSKANENGEIVVGIVKKQHEQANHGRANTIRHLVWWFAVSLKITQSGEVAWRMFRCGVCRTPQNRSISRVNKKDTFRQGDILLPPLEIRCSSPYNICVHNSLLQKVFKRGIIMPICCVCGKKTLNCFIKDHKAYCKSCLKAAGMDSGAIMSRKLMNASDAEIHAAAREGTVSQARIQDTVFEIQQAIKSSETGIGFLGNKSTKSAASMVHEDESVLYAINANVALGEPQGKIKVNTMSFKNKINGTLVITNQRLLFAAESGFSASKAVYLSDIDAVDYSSVGSVIGSVLRVQSRSTVFAIDGNKKILSPFQSKLDEAVHMARHSALGTTVIQSNTPADEIKKYKELLDMGAITEEEFATKKKQLLGL